MSSDPIFAFAHSCERLGVVAKGIGDVAAAAVPTFMTLGDMFYSSLTPLQRRRLECRVEGRARRILSKMHTEGASWSTPSEKHINNLYRNKVQRSRRRRNRK